eukprot:1826550-Rhodomonas_salina.5
MTRCPVLTSGVTLRARGRAQLNGLYHYWSGTDPGANSLRHVRFSDSLWLVLTACIWCYLPTHLLCDVRY